MSRSIDICCPQRKGDLRSTNYLEAIPKMALLATAMAQHDFPEKPDAERFAAIARHVMEQDREELDQLMIFIYEELREILDEAWEATADAEG